MEQIKHIDKIRYIICGSALLIMFLNLYEAIMDNAPLYEYIIYVGVLLVVAIVLMFNESRGVLASLFYVIGIMTIFDDPIVYNVSYGVVFFMFAITLRRNITTRILSWFAILILIVVKSSFADGTSSDIINTVIGYVVLLTVFELLLKDAKEGDNA